MGKKKQLSKIIENTLDDFSFNSLYEIGDKVWVVRINPIIGTKTIIEGTVAAIYPQFLMIQLSGLGRECVGREEYKLIFRSEEEAKAAYADIQIERLL